MANESVTKGVLITGPDGSIYRIPAEELGRYKLAPEEIEKTILEAEAAGFLDTPADEGIAEGCEDDTSMYQPEPQAQAQAQALAGPTTIINIYTGGGQQVAVNPAAYQPTAEEALAPAAGSTMAKYAGGSTMAKYAGGSTMAKYAGGSTMAKYAGGSTMAKYPPGAVEQPRLQTSVTFYGTWKDPEQ